MQADDEKDETSNQDGPNADINPIPETAEEKEKRIRKEASKRMQQKFRERLYARTSGMIEQMNTKPAKLSQGNTNSTPANQSPQAARGAEANNRTDTSATARSNNQPLQPQQVAHQHAVDGGTNEDRSYVDWLIAVIIIAIAALLYRRAASFLNFLPGSVSNTEADHEDTSGSGLIHNLDDM